MHEARIVTLGVAFAVGIGWLAPPPALAAAGQAAVPASAPAPFTAERLDELLAPVALYPDQLLAQMLMAAENPAKVQELSGWLARNEELKGTPLQDAAKAQGFDPSYVLLAVFPQVVNFMADNIQWTRELGQAFTADRQAVLASTQRLRAKSQKAGNLKSTPQQTVETTTTGAGDQVIVIEPANPQVVYVPQYNPQVVYTQPATTTVVVQEDDDDEAIAAVAGAAVGFAAGIAIGAAIDNDYYYGPYGWHGGPRMYNDDWDDFYDDREDAREDWYENREDARDDIKENRDNVTENRSERANTAQQEQTDRQQNRQSTASEAQSKRSAGTASTTASTSARSGEARAAGSTSAEARGTTRATSSGAGRASGQSVDRSGTRSDAFSGYSSGKSERAASSRGSRSRSGGGRGGGRRR